MAENRERKRIQSTCARCGKVFTHRTDHPNKYCSRQCAGMALRKVKPKRYCQYCGNEISPSSSHFYERQYCSVECRDQARRRQFKVTCEECGQQFSKTAFSITRCKHHFCSATCYKAWRVKHPLTGDQHWHWKGGTALVNGYKFRRRIDTRYIGKYEGEHRIVAMKKLGRPLREGEVVHHINGDKMDNRPENLEVMTRSEHIRLHDPRGWRVREDQEAYQCL